ncbi:MAG: HEAT repeat domain-containing protein, partial [Vicinamibacterales bacterium]
VSFSVAVGAESEIDGRDRIVGQTGARSNYPKSVAEAEQWLASDDQRTVAYSADRLRSERSTASIPALLPLLKDSQPWKRRIAAQTIFALGDARVRDVALSLIDDPDPNVSAVTLHWLAEHCTAEQLPLIERRLTPTSADGAAGLGNCGNAATFMKLRPLLDSSDREVRIRALNALIRLTFVGYEGSELSWRATPADWDAWHERRRRDSREEWAARQLLENQPGAVYAADYLRRLNDRRVLRQLRRAASRPDGSLRVAAARGIAQFNRAEGIALLRRELENRQPRICSEALAALNELTNGHGRYDFNEPADRERAVAQYATVRP